MYKLKISEAKAYESIKSGCQTTREISLSTGGAATTVRMDVLYLYRNGLVERIEGGNKHEGYKYKSIPCEYVIVTESQRYLVEDIEDKLVSKALAVNLSDEKLNRIKSMLKTTPRSIIAKDLELSKLELNFAIERMTGRLGNRK